jgi:hypothetical protein
VDRTVKLGEDTVVRGFKKGLMKWLADRAAAKTGEALGKIGMPKAIGPIGPVVGGLEIVGEFGPTIKRGIAINALLEVDTYSNHGSNLTSKLEQWLGGQ